MTAKHIDQEGFDRMIKSGRLTLVNYSAPWCAYCRRISDAYDAIAQEYAEVIDVVKVNTDAHGALASRERIEILPTFVLYEDGEAIGSIVAPESGAMIRDFIQRITGG